jgi:hypothetical protein
MDFSNAFDKVSHSLLLHKPHHYGIQGELNSWIQNCLSNRKQAVVLEGDNQIMLQLSQAFFRVMFLGQASSCITSMTYQLVYHPLYFYLLMTRETLSKAFEKSMTNIYLFVFHFPC